MKHPVILLALLLSAVRFCQAEQSYPATGMVVKVDAPHKTVVISCQSIPGYMDAMVMPLKVLEADDLKGISPGAAVNFTLVFEKDSNYARNLEINKYESVEQDPFTARRLKLLGQLGQLSSDSTKALGIGEKVPDFKLTDQRGRQVSLHQFKGKVMAVNFIYTSCALPNFCFRNSNNFGVLQKRFSKRMGRDLVLLTVTFDPQRDRPDVLARYAKTWKANPATWHFLTGSVPEIQHVSTLFGVDYFPDEGLMNHSLHTAVIDEHGRLAANIEGNQFTPDQLGDLVQAVLDHRNGMVLVDTARLARN